MSTEFPSKNGITRTWLVVHAEDQVLGKLASKAARILMGKHKPDYTPFLATGDHVVVINAAKVRLTGNKEQDKIYRRYSGYPGGLKEITAGQLRGRPAERVVRGAIARQPAEDKHCEQDSR